MEMTMRKKTRKTKARVRPLIAPQQRVWIAEFKQIHTQAAAPIAYIRIVCEVQCAFSTTGDATIDDILVPRLHVEYFGVSGDKVISFIAAP